LHVTRDSISIDYILDMAEIPAFQELATFDGNGNGQPDASEAAAYHAAKCALLPSYLTLLVNNKAVSLAVAASNVEFPAGAGGLPTLRLNCEFKASIASGTEITSLSFMDNIYSERIGWREIVVVANGIALKGDFASTSLSNRLTSYPEALLLSPLDQREITLSIGPVATSQQSNLVSSAQQVYSIPSNRSDKFTELIRLENPTIPTILFALFLSFVWGAIHAMTPGHGKTIVGAYLVGSRGTVKHALYLGLTTTITHTLGVFALGLVTLFASRYIVPEELFPWMTMLSGFFVLAIGLNLFRERFKSSGLGAWFGKLKTNHFRLQPAYSSAVNKVHIETANHAHRFVLASHPIHRHDHSHGIPGHQHYHGDDHTHDHGDHSHMPPETITWRSLLALGISGGLLPCPSALVVLLGAIALNRIGFGMILVLAFSLGLAGALTAIGILFIYAGKLFQRFPTSGKVIGVLPVLSALFVSAIGTAIVYKALLEIGIL
jgi:ABC-type nickel/cobalt efflux system permease component RcnA